MPDLRHLWNHRGIIHRLVVTRGDFNETIEAWSEQDAPPGKNCRPQETWSGDLAEHGPGEQQASRRSWFLDKRFGDVEERDVLEIVSGPEAGKRYRVLSVTKPTNPHAVHHFDIMTEPFVGELTEAVS